MEKKRGGNFLKKKDNTQLLLYEPNVYKSFIILALPVFGANFMKAFNDLVDTFFIGQMQNSVAAQASIALTWPIINIFVSFQIGLSIAGVAVISQFLGAEKDDEAREYAGILFVLSVVLGIAINIILFLICPSVIRGMGATDMVYEYSVQYVRIRSMEMLFAFIFACFQAVRQSQGDTVTPVILQVTAVMINIVLTGVFVKILGLGVFGAGLATVIGQIVICPACLYYLFIRKENLKLRRKNLKLKNWDKVKKLTFIATPSAASQALSSFGFLILNTLILDYGAVVTAAFSVGNKISNMLLMPVLAIGSVLAAYVGQNIGAGNIKRAKQAYKVSRNLSLWISIIGSLIIFPLRQEVIALLTNDANTQREAINYMIWVLVTMPLMAMFQNYVGVFNGSGNTKYSFIMETARLWVVRLPMILLLKNFTNFGSDGIWFAMNASNLIIIILGAILLRRVDFSASISSGKEEITL